MQHALTAFGRRCRELRIQAGYTLNDQFQSMDTTPEVISEIETGGVRPTADYINRFSLWLSLGNAERNSLLCTAAIKANVIAFPKASNRKDGLRLFRKISSMSPADIRDLRRKRLEENGSV